MNSIKEFYTGSTEEQRFAEASELLIRALASLAGEEPEAWAASHGLTLGASIKGEASAEAIGFYAAVAKVTSLGDSGVRIVLDVGEDACQVMRVLAGCKQNGVALRVEATLEP